LDGLANAFLPQLSPTDLLMITADHGCDPDPAGKPRSLPRVRPILAYSPAAATSTNLGVRETLADMGQTIAQNFGAAIPHEPVFSVKSLLLPPEELARRQRREEANPCARHLPNRAVTSSAQRAIHLCAHRKFFSEWMHRRGMTFPPKGTPMKLSVPTHSRSAFFAAILISPATLFSSSVCQGQTDVRTTRSNYVVSVQELKMASKGRTAFDKGSQMLAKGEIAQSIPYLQQAIAQYPEHYMLTYDLGVAHFRLAQQAEAEQASRKPST